MVDFAQTDFGERRGRIDRRARQRTLSEGDGWHRCAVCLDGGGRGARNSPPRNSAPRPPPSVDCSGRWMSKTFSTSSSGSFVSESNSPFGNRHVSRETCERQCPIPVFHVKHERRDSSAFGSASSAIEVPHDSRPANSLRRHRHRRRPRRLRSRSAVCAHGRQDGAGDPPVRDHRGDVLQSGHRRSRQGPSGPRESMPWTA